MKSGIPVSLIERFVGLLEQRGFHTDDIVARTGFARADLADPHRRIAADLLGDVICQCVERAGDPALGIELGLQMKPSSHGLLGLALMTCTTLRDAIAVGERFGELRASPWRIELHVEGALASMRFVDAFSMGRARTVMFEAVVGAAVVIGEFILGLPLAHPDIEFWSDSPELPHHARYRARLPRIRYACPRNEARFPSTWLDRPLVLGEPLAHREVVTVLERERELRVVDETNLVERTRTLLADPVNAFPDLETAAAALGVSSRTLRRHLRERGSTFQTLRDDARRAHALHLLERSALSIDAIARELAYSDAPSFVRAFQRWTGDTPHNHRRRAGV